MLFQAVFWSGRRFMRVMSKRFPRFWRFLFGQITLFLRVCPILSRFLPVAAKKFGQNTPNRLACPNESPPAAGAPVMPHAARRAPNPKGRCRGRLFSCTRGGGSHISRNDSAGAPYRDDSGVYVVGRVLSAGAARHFALMPADVSCSRWVLSLCDACGGFCNLRGTYRRSAP